MDTMGQGHFTRPNTIGGSNPAVLNTLGEFPSFDRRRLGLISAGLCSSQTLKIPIINHNILSSYANGNVLLFAQWTTSPRRPRPMHL